MRFPRLFNGHHPPSPSLLALSPRELWVYEVRRSTPVHIRCLAGTVWLTFLDGKDHVLEPGDAWTARGKGKVVVQALAPVELEIRPLR